MKIIEDLEQGSPAWHALRRKSIGASDASIILGNNPWKDEYTLFQEKMGLHVEPETDAMRKGKELEPLALFQFNYENDLQCSPCVVQSDDLPWQIASLDGMDGDKIVEIKCSLKLYSQAQQGIIPQMYIDQMQHQLCVTQLPMCYYYAYWQGNGVMIEVKRDDAYIADLVVKQSKFYQRMVKFDPPEPKHRETSNPEWLQRGQKINERNELIKQLRKENDLDKEWMISDAQSKNTKGGGITLTKVIRPGVINYNAILEQFEDVDVEAYRSEPVEYWVITKERKNA